MKKAVVCLTRGYSDTKKYKDLITRNVGIWSTINQDLKYDLVIFHEGNISADHQNHITKNSMGQNVIFSDISDVWSGGYEGMCRFMIYDIWEKCKDYDWVMRVDEDCVLQRIIYDPFDQVINRNCFYGASVFWAESHSETNSTLPQFISEISGANAEDFYDHKFPYTNVSIANVQFMRSLPSLKYISESPLQRSNRWGDLPVLGSMLNIYAKDKVAMLSGLNYYHSSHNVNVNCE